MTHTPSPTQDDLATGRSLDALIAEKVLRNQPPPVKEWRRDWLVQVPAYSTDIGAAWQIIEHMDSLGWKVQIRSDSQLEGYEVDAPWVCVFASRNGAPWAAANTAPLAVCRAALKAVSAQP